MGWCSGTEVFDKVADKLLEIDKSAGLGRNVLEEVLETLRDALEDKDWDCQNESDYWDDPVIGPLLGNTFEEDEED